MNRMQKYAIKAEQRVSSDMQPAAFYIQFCSTVHHTHSYTTYSQRAPAVYVYLFQFRRALFLHVYLFRECAAAAVQLHAAGMDVCVLLFIPPVIRVVIYSELQHKLHYTGHIVNI